jgi:hypothetical protein
MDLPLADYGLHKLPCWSCPALFDYFTELSEHHYACHRRPDPPLPGPSIPWVANGQSRLPVAMGDRQGS